MLFEERLDLYQLQWKTRFVYSSTLQGGNPGLTVVIQGQGQTQGQLQIIPQGVTVIPGPGQQLMQAAMPNGQVQRFLFTPVPPSSSVSSSSPTTTTKPAVAQTPQIQGPAQVQTTPALAQTQMTAPVPSPTQMPRLAPTPASVSLQTQVSVASPLSAPAQCQMSTSMPAQVLSSTPASVHTQPQVARPVLAPAQNAVSTLTAGSFPTQTQTVVSLPVPGQVAPQSQLQTHAFSPVPALTSAPLQMPVAAPAPALAPISGPSNSAQMPVSASLPSPVQVPTPALAPVSAPVIAVVSTQIAGPSTGKALTQIQPAAPVPFHAAVANAVVTPVTATFTTPSVPGKQTLTSSFFWCRLSTFYLLKIFYMHKNLNNTLNTNENN